MENRRVLRQEGDAISSALASFNGAEDTGVW